MPMHFDNTYAHQLEGFYAPWQGDDVPEPRLLKLNTDLADELGLDSEWLSSERGVRALCGAENPDGGFPLAMAYAGHQFGNFSPQLGDGRAILVGEILSPNGKRHDLHLKGSGATPFSRGGDGKAGVGPVLREYLIGEAMHALGVPTTRALAAVSTGEQIARETPQPGAVLARVAASHIRVGTFQFFAARGEQDRIRTLADYTIARHFPDVQESASPYLELLKSVSNAQARLVSQWMLIGFVHGVMNTDNTTASGETIDYGPCAFMERYDPRTVFSSIDLQGRYAFGNQPAIAQWNLARFAETLLPLIDASEQRAIEEASAVITDFNSLYETHWLAGMRRKLGLHTAREEDLQLCNELFEALSGTERDFTRFFRGLSDCWRGHGSTCEDNSALANWHQQYVLRAGAEEVPDDERAKGMDRVNPLYIPRNHKVEEALSSALEDDLAPFEKLLKVLSTPFDERPGCESYTQPAPPGSGRYRTFCGT